MVQVIFVFGIFCWVLIESNNLPILFHHIFFLIYNTLLTSCMLGFIDLGFIDYNRHIIIMCCFYNLLHS